MIKESDKVNKKTGWWHQLCYVTGCVDIYSDQSQRGLNVTQQITFLTKTYRMLNIWVCVCSWSRDGHKLVSASTDNIVSQWDVLTGDCDQRFRFPSPILKLQCHPRDMWVICTCYIWGVLIGDIHWRVFAYLIFISDRLMHFNNPTNLCFCFRDKVLVCPMKSAPVLLTLSDSKHVVLPVDDDSDLNVVAAFDRRGEYIYTGNAKGKVSLSIGQTLFTVHFDSFTSTYFKAAQISRLWLRKSSAQK